MPRSLMMSAARGVSRAASAMRRTEPRSRPRTSSSVITSFADSSRVTVGPDDEVGGADGVDEADGFAACDELDASNSAGAALLKTSRTNARTRSLVASSAIFWSAVTCHRLFFTEVLGSLLRLMVQNPER